MFDQIAVEKSAHCIHLVTSFAWLLDSLKKCGISPRKRYDSSRPEPIQPPKTAERYIELLLNFTFLANDVALIAVGCLSTAGEDTP